VRPFVWTVDCRDPGSNDGGQPDSNAVTEGETDARRGLLEARVDEDTYLAEEAQGDDLDVDSAAQGAGAQGKGELAGGNAPVPLSRPVSATLRKSGGSRPASAGVGGGAKGKEAPQPSPPVSARDPDAANPGEPYLLHPTPGTLHPTLCILHPTVTRLPTPYTLHPTLRTQHPTLLAWQPKP
jgi:hypothetical protein